MSVTIERVAIGTLVCAVSILTLVGLLAIWGWVDGDIVWKSYSTIGVIGLAALVVVGIARVSSKYYGQPAAPAPESPTWKAMRNLILGIMGAAFLVFTVLSIAAIWNFVGGDTLWKAISSMGYLFISAVILLVAFNAVD